MYSHCYLALLISRDMYIKITNISVVVCAGKDAHSPRVKSFSCKLISGLNLCSINMLYYVCLAPSKKQTTPKSTPRSTPKSTPKSTEKAAGSAVSSPLG